ncbi:hypothetical protein Q5H91_11145 [Sphingomonas sp. KR1UV-12]|uniref:Type II secretion system protein GspF domain-containing protein n=1 Tax=Sphingomonas aurea TaxID=3063994 RepID=A0ABT9ELS4_9SPHN|nr:hypothetical protein [Sphingomonas sp. KR1UV-12]MDP1027772.1 hypothetical protein [Sphingomonas sp. KR1UV-12]
MARRAAPISGLPDGGMISRSRMLQGQGLSTVPTVPVIILAASPGIPIQLIDMEAQQRRLRNEELRSRRILKTAGTSVREAADEPAGAAAQRHEIGQDAGDVDRGTTDLERSVIMLSLTDSLSSVQPQGRFARALSAIFGLKAANPIADPRLEALRAYAVRYRTRSVRDGCGDVVTAMAAGANAEALATARRIIDARAAYRPTRISAGTRIFEGSAALAAASWLFHTLMQELGDTIPALVVTLLAATTIFSWMLPRNPR